MKYKLKAGSTHWHPFPAEKTDENGNTVRFMQQRRLEAGDEVELTEKQAAAFRDRFEPVGPSEKKGDAETAEKSARKSKR